MKNTKLALLMLNAIEEMTIENLALRSTLLQANRHATPEKIDSIVRGALAQPVVRDTVRAQWLPLRQKLQDDSSLEEALQQFLQITPRPKGVN